MANGSSSISRVDLKPDRNIHKKGSSSTSAKIVKKANASACKTRFPSRPRMRGARFGVVFAIYSSLLPVPEIRICITENTNVTKNTIVAMAEA